MALNGIDISSYQRDIDLHKISGDFVIVKATEGTSYRSDSFVKQMDTALDSGKLIGAYHYSNGNDAAGEADYFLSVVKPYLGKTVLCLDWEGQGNPLFGSGKDYDYIRKFASRIIEKSGVKPLVYVSASYLKYVKQVCEELDLGLWVAQYGDDNDTSYQEHPWNEGAYQCAIRQYSSHGKLEGYSSYLDLDIAYMTREAWYKYAAADNTTDIIISEAADLDQYTDEQLADRVLEGIYGNGNDRKIALGNRYQAVQNIINKRLK